MSGLPFGPLENDTLFVCIDMQRLFLEPGEWYCPAGLQILPAVTRLARRAGERCLFTRFITPHSAEQAPGRWRHYYRRWRSVTRAERGAAALELHPELAALPGRRFDKTTHDAFGSDEFSVFVAAADPPALVLFGIETDVCVLATALSAVDRGWRVVVVSDAVAGSVPASHRACLELLLPRFDQQIEIATAATVLAAWESG